MRNEPMILAGGLPSFEKIVELEDVLLGSGEPPAQVRLTHYFAPGVYVREVLIPAGVVLVGKIHKTEHVCIVSCGRVISATELSQEEIVGPKTFVTQAGTKRALYCLEDCLWATVHPTTDRDLAAIEDQFIAKSREEFVAWARGGLLEGLQCRG